MTFLSELARLREAATKGPWVVKNGNITTIPRYSRWGAGMNESGMVHKLISVQPDNAELIAYLVNHAEAIEELVKAAEYVLQDEINLIPRADSKTRAVVAKALEKLNRSE